MYSKCNTSLWTRNDFYAKCHSSRYGNVTSLPKKTTQSGRKSVQLSQFRVDFFPLWNNRLNSFDKLDQHQLTIRLSRKNENCQFHICFSAWITIWQFHRILQFHMSTVMLIVKKFSKKSYYFITVQFFGVKWWKDEGGEGKGIFVLIFLLTVSFWSKSFGRLKRTRG